MMHFNEIFLIFHNIALIEWFINISWKRSQIFSTILAPKKIMLRVIILDLHFHNILSKFSSYCTTVWLISRKKAAYFGLFSLQFFQQFLHLEKKIFRIILGNIMGQNKFWWCIIFSMQLRFINMCNIKKNRENATR